MSATVATVKFDDVKDLLVWPVQVFCTHDRKDLLHSYLSHMVSLSEKTGSVSPLHCIALAVLEMSKVDNGALNQYLLGAEELFADMVERHVDGTALYAIGARRSCLLMRISQGIGSSTASDWPVRKIVGQLDALMRKPDEGNGNRAQVESYAIQLQIDCMTFLDDFVERCERHMDSIASRHGPGSKFPDSTWDLKDAGYYAFSALSLAQHFADRGDRDRLESLTPRVFASFNLLQHGRIQNFLTELLDLIDAFSRLGLPEHGSYLNQLIQNKENTSKMQKRLKDFDSL